MWACPRQVSSLNRGLAPPWSTRTYLDTGNGTPKGSIMTAIDDQLDEGKPLECSHCGAPLPVDPLAQNVTCTRCGTEWPIDSELRAKMNAYVGDVSKFIRDELVARYHAAFFVQNEVASRPVIVGALGIAYALVFGVGAWMFARNGPYVLQSHVGILMLIWAPALASFSYGWARVYAMPSPEAMAGQRTAQCAGCGAMQTFSAGEAASDCRYCHATLLVPAEIASRLLVELINRATRSERVRLATLVEVQTRLDKNYVTVGVVAMVLGVPVGMAVAVSLYYVGGTPASPSELLLFMGIPLLLALSFLVSVTVRARNNFRRILALADRLTSRARLDDAD
jgi:DNA-directed RNA polymerase subunit RPC12/RpoP